MEFFKPGNEVNIKVLNGDKVTEIFDYEQVFKDSYVKCIHNLESQINVFDK
jgi:predicted DNA-binding antitoxin AbrB/MazE fold protein